MEYLLQLDENIYLFLNNLGNKRWDQIWLIITNKWAWIPFYIFLLYLIYKKLPLKKVIIILVLVTLLITLTDQTTNLFKAYFQRLRPCQLDFEHRAIAYCAKYGFFSGHAANSMALAIFVGQILKKQYKFILIGLIFWSFLLGYSRIYVGVHYPGDVLVGFTFGVIYGLIFHQLYVFLCFSKYIIKK